MKKTNTKWKYPRTRLQWLWDNMEGGRFLYICAMLGTVVYNMLQLTVPFFSGKIVDRFLAGDSARQEMAEHSDQFFMLLGLMVGLTILRCLIVYFDCMAYEKVSQHVLFKVRNFLYDKIQRQDMNFYSKYRTGDLMTRVTGDLDAVRHMVAWVVRMVVEAVSLVSATAIYFIAMNWQLAFCCLLLRRLSFLSSMYLSFWLRRCMRCFVRSLPI